MQKNEKHENPFQFMITQKLGKTIVTKTLALLLFVHVLTILPNPPFQVMQEIQHIIIKF